MAKNGTSCSCSNVNRAFHCDDDSLATYIPDSFLEDKDVAEKVLK